ncbi:MAG TPA: hypothetical protein VF469_32560, partial [Kofleriaceae bacterium]
MTRLVIFFRVALAAILVAGLAAGLAAGLTVAPAAAQPAPPDATSTPIAPIGQTGSCVQRERPAAAAPSTLGAPPVNWSDFDIEGELQDPPDTVHTLFTPVMTRLARDPSTDVAQVAAQYGYALVELGARTTPQGSRAVLRLAPRPLVRKVDIDIKQSPFTTVLDDQVRRRMRIRTGTYLPWKPDERKCELDEEQAHIADYLHFEEGYFDARVEHHEILRGNGLELTIRIELGGEYRTGSVLVANPQVLAQTTIDPQTVVQQFQHDSCLLCLSTSRFTRARHIEDKQRVVKLFQRQGYPAVR